jgi:hypothetical protein
VLVDIGDGRIKAQLRVMTQNLSAVLEMQI